MILEKQNKINNCNNFAVCHIYTDKTNKKTKQNKKQKKKKGKAINTVTLELIPGAIYQFAHHIFLNQLSLYFSLNF